MDMWDQYTNTYHLIAFRNNLISGNYVDDYLNSIRQDEIKLVLGSHFYGVVPIIFIKSPNNIVFNGNDEYIDISSGNIDIGGTEGIEVKTIDLNQEPTIWGYIGSIMAWFKNWI